MNEPTILKPSYTTTCRLCRQTFAGKPLEPPSPLGHPSPRMQQAGKMLLDHMQKQHPNEASMIMLAAAFLFEDPEAIKFTAFWRAMAFQSLRRHIVPDATLKDRLARLTTPEETEAAFFELRDFLSETGPYGVKVQQAPANGTEVKP